MYEHFISGFASKLAHALDFGLEFDIVQMEARLAQAMHETEEEKEVRGYDSHFDKGTPTWTFTLR